MLDTITREVAKGEKVAITGFGSFEKRVRDARWVRNPRTGERIKAKKTAIPKFSAGADLKAVVSGAKKLPKLTLAAAAPLPALPARPRRPATGTAKKAPAKKAPAEDRRRSPRRRPPAKKSRRPRQTAAKKAPAKKAARRQEGAGEEDGHEDDGRRTAKKTRRRRPGHEDTGQEDGREEGACQEDHGEEDHGQEGLTLTSHEGPAPVGSALVVSEVRQCRVRIWSRSMRSPAPSPVVSSRTR